MADSRSTPSWIAAPNVGWAWVVVAGLVWSALLVGVSSSELGHYLEARIARPLDFRIRSALGMDPPLSERLKIYSYDDSTFAKFGRPFMTLDQWADVLGAIDAAEPAAIVIDQIFAFRPDALSADVSTALASLARVKAPIVVGSFVSPVPVRYREDLPLDRPEYSLATLLGDGGAGAVAEDRLPPLPDRTKWFAYGPSADLRARFAHIGHIVYEGGGTIEPLLRMKPDAALGHLSMYLARERKIEGGRLVLDGRVVPMDADGRVVVNFRPLGGYDDKTLRSVLTAAAKGKRLQRIKKGDVVLILPVMYTGGTDFATTPFGHIPGGYVIASMINSVLTGNWLRPLVGGEALTVLLVATGLVLGVKCAALAFWTALLALVVVALATGQYLFAAHGIVVPWLFPITGLIGAAVTVFAEKTRAGERKVQALRVALEGSVAEGDLKSILKNPERVALDARERVVTLMFIDVVGFSLLAENMLPRMAFDNLKKTLATIGDAIHEFGGIIDKTLGDGLLCYFGYRFDSDASTPDHAEKALRCAIKIQRDNLMRNIEAAENGEPVYPLRIGVNTSSCYLGDLGTSNRIDFTVVGNGVNFAKRLEGACEMHSVLMGGTTYDLVKGIGLPAKAMTKRFIRIKHHSELVEAHEFDPFLEEPDLRAAALEGFRKCANIQRVDHRWPVHDPSKIQLSCDFGAGVLMNFSHTGLSVKLTRFLAKGTRLNIALDGAGGALKALLAKEGIDILQGEVRWGYAEGNDFVHGILLTNVSDHQSDFLVQYLCEFAFSRDAKAS
jgi:class 3 adenylate cyclase/CHASE2 domain-containing sensor protein